MTAELDFEPFRVELTGYCYRMLGAGSEAEDAVQETFIRAWKANYDERRASLRTWLYRIATNICVDMLRSTQRRALAMDLGPAATPGAPLGEPAPAHLFVQPIADHRALPEDTAVQRESIRLAFVAALQHLPPKQRAVLILRDVLCWHTDEVALLLETTVPAVTSALQRARAALPAAPGDPLHPGDPAQRALLDRYVSAFESHDVDALVALLHEDARSSMPPFRWWLSGRATIAQVLAAATACDGDRLIPVRANGSPAFRQLRDNKPFGLLILTTDGDHITTMTTYLGAPSTGF